MSTNDASPRYSPKEILQFYIFRIKDFELFKQHRRQLLLIFLSMNGHKNNNIFYKKYLPVKLSPELKQGSASTK